MVLDSLRVAVDVFEVVVDGFMSFHVLELTGEKVQHMLNLISFDIKRLSHPLWKAIAMDNAELGQDWQAKTLQCNYI